MTSKMVQSEEMKLPAACRGVSEWNSSEANHPSLCEFRNGSPRLHPRPDVTSGGIRRRRIKDFLKVFSKSRLSRLGLLVTICWLLFTGYSLLVTSAVFAVPPPPGFPKPDGQTCFINREASQKRLASRAKCAPGFAPPIAATAYKVVVIRVDFSDNPMTKTEAETTNVFTNFRSYFWENSYSLLTLNITVSPSVYRMPQTHAHYANGINSLYNELTQDAIAISATAGFDFSSYDHMMIYHAGNGAETTNNSNVWSVYAPSNLVNGPVASGKTFPGVTVVPEGEGSNIDPLGVICHEYGHQLGLPDLYNSVTGAAQVGKWSLMDSGIYIGSPSGSNPAHLDAWSKLFLGFAAPGVVSYTQGLSTSVAQTETTRSAFIRIPIEVSDVGGANEYFLLEYRKTSGAIYDAYLPASGLLIWHIDDGIASSKSRLDDNTVNIGSPHRGVDLVEAGTSDSSTGGDESNPWPGLTSNTTFQSPKSNSYNGKDSQISVTGITLAGATVSMLVKNLLGTTLDTKEILFSDNSKLIYPETVGSESIIATTITQPKPDTAGIKGSGIAFDLTLQSGKSTLPEAVNLICNYNLGTLASKGLIESLLRLAFHNGNEWVVVAGSSVDTVTKKVTAKIKHFSQYQIVQVIPQNNFTSSIAFPNPSRPSQGDDRINFNKIPANAHVRIYTLSGEFVRQLDDDGGGNVAWFLDNENGERMASGTYLALIQSEVGRKVMKVAVQR